ncbi:MAG: phosphate ABC transporter permease PstA [Acidobacteriota bacterium]
MIPGGFLYLRRKAVNVLLLTLSAVSALFGLVFLVWILREVILRGARALNWAFFTQLPAPPGVEAGGMANALVGTLLISLLAVVLGVPTGILAGTYLAEYGRKNALARAVRFVSDILASSPSIVVGVFVYAILVKPLGSFSGLSGAVALAILMIPVVTRTSEEMLRLVPDTLREAALALGAPQWKVIVAVCYRRVLGGLATGVLLAVARVSGETAPLLFTALNNPYWNWNPFRPTGTLNVTLFNYAMSPYDDWRAKAWGAALLITLLVLATTLVARLVVSRTEIGRS